MGVNPEHFYKVMLAAYHSGIIDKVMMISGDALAEFLDRTDYDMGDIFNRVDEASDGLINKMDSLIGLMGPLVRFAASERLFKIVSRMLDFTIVKQIITFLFNKIMITMMEGRSSPSIITRLKTVFHQNTTS